MKHLVLIESIFWYLSNDTSDNFLVIAQVCPWVISSSGWMCISWYRKLPEDFITKFQDKVYWHDISICQKLSEGFMTKFQDKVDWEEISSHQKLSEEFITKFQERVDWKIYNRQPTT